MKYVISGLVGFMFTLVLSMPLQFVLRQARGASWNLKGETKGQSRIETMREEIEIKVPPLVQGKDPEELRIKFIPQYPADAAAKLIEGYVLINFDISREGSVENLRVVESFPPKIFDEAATAAVSRWAFAIRSGRSQEQSLRLNFNLNRTLAADQRVDKPGL